MGGFRRSWTNRPGWIDGGTAGCRRQVDRVAAADDGRVFGEAGAAVTAGTGSVAAYRDCFRRAGSEIERPTSTDTAV
ncbi:hypothetical protein JCM9534A_58880 [Catenuloplanes indicus JCM 9534]